MLRFALGSVFLLASIHSSLCATLNVTVGGPGVLRFNPPSVNANVGDVVRFTFQQKNHTVTQSTLDSPCIPFAGGFDTGFIPVADTVTSNFPTAELTVSRTSPIWAYCRQGNHCQQGMVFAINPGDKLAAFQAAATGGTASRSASATASSTSATSTSTAIPTSQDHKIVVGGPGVLAFNPPNITAQVGDTITFEFHQKNHTVTASAFETPCRDLRSSSGQSGFDSGFFPVADGATTFPTYIVQVNDTKPIWAFCRQGSHCTQGMVFAVNTVESGPKNFAAFLALAKQSTNTSSTPYTTPGTSDSRTIVKSAFSTTAAAMALFILSLFF